MHTEKRIKQAIESLMKKQRTYSKEIHDRLKEVNKKFQPIFRTIRDKDKITREKSLSFGRKHKR